VEYLIDGHNLIGRLSDLRLDDPEDEQKLTARLQLFAQRVRALVSVVFDPGPAYGTPRRPAGGDVQVIYARPGHTADQVIATRARREGGRRGLIVVTSDRELTARVRAEGVQVMTAEAFAGLLAPAVAPAEEPDEEAERAHPHITSDEVEAWLREFSAARRRKQKRP